MSRSPRAAIALALTFAFAAGCGKGSGTPAAAKPGAGRTARKVPVEVLPAARRPINWTIATVGQVEADEIVRIPARVAGVIQDIAFREGARVVRGTLLARIDPERYRLAFARAEAALAESEAQLKEAEAAYAKRRALRERDPGWVSEEELSNFNARVEERRAAVAASRAQLELARKDLRDSDVRAESPGVVNEKLVDTGQFLAAGSPVATMVDTRRLRLAFKVAESESVRLRDGGRVRFSVRSLPGREFEARIYHVGEAADTSTRQVPCLAWIEGESAGELRPGFFADVSIEVETRDSLAIPVGATLASDRGFLAWVLNGPATAESRVLELGLTTKDGWVEVRAGIAEGEQVIVRGGAAMRPGVEVEIVEPAGSAEERR